MALREKKEIFNLSGSYNPRGQNKYKKAKANYLRIKIQINRNINHDHDYSAALQSKR